MNLYGKTDIGKAREENQDCFGYRTLDCGMTLLAVCDGMGGESGGATAASMALESFLDSCNAKLKEGMTDAEIRTAVSLAVSEANTAVFKKSEECEELRGMGTTLVSALIEKDEKRVFIINIGDSRAYAAGNKGITQLSHDHSYVQYLIDRGELTPFKAAWRKDRNMIMRAIGIEESARADIDIIEINKSEEAPSPTYILLCSDGLTGMVKDGDIKKHLIGDGSLEEKADALVALANKKGGQDNITVLISEI